MRSLISVDYHTHTRYSHGTGSVEDNVRAAIDCGLSAVGISDHGIKQIAHGVKPDALLRQIDEIAELNEKYAGKIRILSSIESDITGLDGSIDLPEDWQDKFDYVLGGYHRTAVPNRIWDIFSLQIPALFRIRSKKLSERMTRVDELAIRSGRLFAVTHPGEYIPVDLLRVARAAEECGVYVEINNKHPMKKEDLCAVLQTNAKFILSSDAHAPERVGRVERAYEAAMEAGVPRERIVNLLQEG